jgi:hypothetical protein
MSSFYEFVKQNEGEVVLALPCSGKPSGSAEIFNAVVGAVGLLPPNILAISASDTNRFSQELAAIVSEDSFLKTLSDSIQKPKQDESEEEFVSRSKLVLLGLIDQKLDSK